jgi:serine phosphatase RsbU (regulator of sigma subunit)
MTKTPPMTKAQRTLEQARRLVRDYTGEETVGEFKRLFDRDAAEAYQILSRDRSGREPDDDVERFAYRVRIFFAGLSAKLSPARRLLFVLGLALVAWSVVDIFFNVPNLQTPLLLAAAIFFFLFTMELVDRVRVRDELEVARELQRGLLPREAPSLDEYRFAHSYRTANEVGGDYYDFLPLPDGRLALVVGDASGHGIAAGLLMAIANATLKTAIDVDPEPERAVSILNRTLCRTGDSRAFMSLFYGVLDPATGALDYVCAGHPYPLLRRRRGTLEELGQGGLPLGLKEDLTPRVGTTRIDPGDLVLLYSDGLVEAVREDGEAFGYERLARLLAEVASPQAMHDHVLTEFDRFVGDRPLHDDLTLVIVAREDRPVSAV